MSILDLTRFIYHTDLKDDLIFFYPMNEMKLQIDGLRANAGKSFS
jgi:hypothetical protein